MHFTASTKNLEQYFQKFRKNTVGYNQTFKTPYGKQTIHYFDWTASGRLYGPIEDTIKATFGAFVGNTHSESSETGTAMTLSYTIAREIIKKHVHANSNDILIMTGTGMTGAISKLQRILGLKTSDQSHKYASFIKKKNHSKLNLGDSKPVVFITHMEHHSNQTSWGETDVDVVVLMPNKKGLITPEDLEKLLKQYEKRNIKIGSFTASSNVTGMQTPIHALAKMMHKYGGYCFIDFAAAAPYISINMHPKDPEEKLDAIFFSPHKFLGGPGTPGVLLFNEHLYPHNLPPDHPGGGTVIWTDPWGGRGYQKDIETREDGGTPGFLQTIKTALSILLKEKMGVSYILSRERYLLSLVMNGFKQIPQLHVLDDNGAHRLGIISFYIENIHYNLLVKLLNDRFGIQTRGGCSCAGTYGHCLLHITKKQSKLMAKMSEKKDFSTKPGWVRISLHPTLLDKEVHQLIQAVKDIVLNIDLWKKDYTYNPSTNEFTNNNWDKNYQKKKIAQWFNEWEGKRTNEDIEEHIGLSSAQ